MATALPRPARVLYQSLSSAWVVSPVSLRSRCARSRLATALRGRRALSPNSAELLVEVHSSGGPSDTDSGRYSSSSQWLAPSRPDSGMREVKLRDARETAHEVRQTAYALLAGDASVPGGRTSVALSLGAW